MKTKKTLRETLAENAKAEKLWAAMHGKPVRDLPAIPEKRQRKSASPPAVSEADVLSDISEYLRSRGDVIFCIRQNSGAAQSANGLPVYFYRWVKGRSMRMPDLWGMDANGRMFAIEVKRPGWTKVRDQREVEQQSLLTLVVEYGGRAGFATSVLEAARIMGPDMGDDH